MWMTTHPNFQLQLKVRLFWNLFHMLEKGWWYKNYCGHKRDGQLYLRFYNWFKYQLEHLPNKSFRIVAQSRNNNLITEQPIINIEFIQLK